MQQHDIVLSRLGWSRSPLHGCQVIDPQAVLPAVHPLAALLTYQHPERRLWLTFKV
jgi:hypothetical protein